MPDLLDLLSPRNERAEKYHVYAKVGSCAHWVRPNQKRWTAAGGFAWPGGYGGSSGYGSGFPELDWFERLEWDGVGRLWRPISRFAGKRQLVLRVAAPARTARHRRAVVATLWSPGSPDDPVEKKHEIFGFEKRQGDWHRVAEAMLSRHGQVD